ncbi:MAG: plasmid mobilization relaxosome protein MobC [Lachnospiraceae bacterium]|nr:plasmid mobilization relaxosome protein MobC [Lachnospiraceae bacterium]
MKNRSRNNSFTLYLNDDEKRILDAKWKLSGMKSRSAYIRQMLLEGIVYDVDYSELREYNYQLGKIGNNINQIAHKVNSTDEITGSEIDALKKEMDEVWRLQKSMLSQQVYLQQ